MKNAVTFRSIEHRSRFHQTIQEIGKVYGRGTIDPYYGSALYILTADLTVWTKVFHYLTATGLDFVGISDDLFLTDEATILVHVAHNLFNGQAHVDPVKLAELSESNLDLIIPAILLRQGNTTLYDL